MAERRHPYEVRGGATIPETTTILDRDVHSAAQARQWLSAFLEPLPVQSAFRQDALLVMSELVTNALLHGQGLPVVRATVTPESMELAVTDSGQESPHLQEIDPTRIGGLGLLIVDRLCSAWGVSRFPGGKTVWATMPIE
jgi:anti-sigma regulatory factor (Ser/Thr protein kinase)